LANVYSLSGTLLGTCQSGIGCNANIRANGQLIATVERKRIDRNGSQVWQWFPTFRGNDHLGSSQIGFDLDGIVDFQEYYTPFGEVENASSLNDNKVGFTGHIRDADTGLNYMQARLQDPVTGRFLSIDPIGFAETGDTRYINRFSYTANDPINLFDPNGAQMGVPHSLGCHGAGGSADDCFEINRAAINSEAAGIFVGSAVVLSGGAACYYGGCQAMAAAGTTFMLNAPRAAPLVGSAGAVGGETVRQISNAGQQTAQAAQQFLFRGVHANHPSLGLAQQGIVQPGNVNGTVTATQHNLGGANVLANSPFTSWTRDINVALERAGARGPGGTLLRVPVGAPPNGATWSWQLSPDKFGESEVLLRGTRTGVEVVRPEVISNP